MSTQDYKYASLRDAGYEGSVDDMFHQYIAATTGEVNASERDLWSKLYPTGVGTLNDIKRQYFTSLGFTGCIQDQENQFWNDGIV